MAETQDYIQTLQEAIRKGHGCQSKHAASAPVQEVFQGRTVWKGTVAVFDPIGHPAAKLAYAGDHVAQDTGHEVRIVTRQGVPPMDSPRRVVPASILSEIKKGRK